MWRARLLTWGRKRLAGLARMTGMTGMIASVVAITLAFPSTARASFSAEQAADLAQGRAVIQPLELQRGDHRFVGGVSYLVIDQPLPDLSSIVRDVGRFHELMPNVAEAKLVAILPSGAATVRITHAVGPMRGGYTLTIAFSEGGRLGRFWIDAKADNAVEDAWGFVRLTPIEAGRRTLVTYAVLFDLGTGVLRTLFESRIQKAALSYPSRLADAASY